MEKTQKFRLFSLIFFLVLFTIFSLRHFILGGKVAASVDALCPFGGFETFLTWIATGALVPRVMISSLILALGVIITVLLFRRGFCGWICPFGAIQEFLGKITKKKIKIPKKLDFYLRYLKYLILIIIIVGTFITGILIFRDYDPFATFFHFGKGIFWEIESEEFFTHLIPFIITISILVASVFIERFWCKYLCPLGAFMGILSKLGLTKISKQKGCNNCTLCKKKCPVGIDVCKDDHIKSAECISCMQCTSICPKSCLKPKILKKTFSPILYGSLVLVVFFSVIFIAKASGNWKSVPSSSITDVQNQLNPDLIKGWMTFDDIAKELNMDPKSLINKLNLPNYISPDTSFKDVKSVYDLEFETSAVRDFISDYNSGSDNKKDLVCPWNLKNDPYPGRCGLYTDEDKNNLCDYSE